MVTRLAGCSVLLLTIAGANVPAGGSEKERAAPPREEALLETLRALVAKRRENLAEQEVLWPGPRRAQLDDASPPRRVKRLQSELKQLCSRIRVTQTFLAEAAPSERVLGAIRESRDGDLVEALFAVARDMRVERDALADAVIEATRELPVLSRALVDGLANLDSSRASEYLLERGIEQNDVTLLVAAARAGHPHVVEQLIDAVENGEDSFAHAALRALARLSPPARSRSELVDLVTKRIHESTSPGLKAQLIVYLGRIADAGSTGLLAALARRADERRVRLAALGSLGAFGERGGEILLDELLEARDPVVRRTCVRALASTGHRPAIPYLIDLLEQSSWERDAQRSLCSITKENVESAARWRRWWRHQPDTNEPADPDDG